MQAKYLIGTIANPIKKNVQVYDKNRERGFLIFSLVLAEEVHSHRSRGWWVYKYVGLDSRRGSSVAGRISLDVFLVRRC